MTTLYFFKLSKRLKAAHTLVIGAGSWGIALSIHLQRSQPHRVALLSRNPAKAEEKLAALSSSAKDFHFYDRIPKKFDTIKSILIATPSSAVAGICDHLSIYGFNKPILCCSKGLANVNQIQRLDEYFYQLQPRATNFSYLAGPTFAHELAHGKITHGIVASSVIKQSVFWQKELYSNYFSIERSNDMTGVAWCGVIKNIAAMLAGMAAGVNLGDNARSIILCRATATLQNLCIHFGGQAQTAYSIAGIGDIILSGTSTQSRNYQLGMAISQNQDYPQQTSESHYNIPIAAQLLQDQNLQSSMINLADKCLKNPKTAAQNLVQWLEKPFIH